jgi:hypothetical protein
LLDAASMFPARAPVAVLGFLLIVGGSGTARADEVETEPPPAAVAPTEPPRPPARRTDKVVVLGGTAIAVGGVAIAAGIVMTAIGIDQAGTNCDVVPEVHGTPSDYNRCLSRNRTGPHLRDAGIIVISSGTVVAVAGLVAVLLRSGSR